MPKTRKVQLSFSGGEIDTHMYGRIDAQQYQSGLATCKNWMVDPRGSLRRRPGMQRVADSLNSTKKSRLIPFTYSVDQQLAIELGDQKVGFHAGGGTLVWANLKKFSYLVSANIITFDEPHGFAQDESIAFYARLTPGGGGNPNADPFSALPAPLDDRPNRPNDGVSRTDRWAADVVDSRRIKVRDPFDNSIANLTNGDDRFDLYAFSTGTTEGQIGPARLYKRQFLGDGGDKVNLFRPAGSDDYCLQFGDNTDREYLRDDWKQGECVQVIYRQNVTGAPRAPLPGIPTKLYVDYTAGGTAGCGTAKFGLRTSREFVGTAKDARGETYVSAASIEAAFDAAGDGFTSPSTGDKQIHIVQFHEPGELLYVDYRLPATLAWVSSSNRARIFRVNTGFISPNTTPAALDTALAANCTQVDDSGAFDLPTPFTESELFDIEYDQSGDVVTLTHPNHPPQDLKRFGPTNWTLEPVDFSPELPAPTNVGVTAERGQSYTVIDVSQAPLLVGGGLANVVVFETAGPYPFVEGDQVYVFTPDGQSDYVNALGLTNDAYYNVQYVASTSGIPNGISLRTLDGEPVRYPYLPIPAPVLVQGFPNDLNIYYSVATADRVEEYRVTAIDARGQESLPSDTASADNVLSVPGASNTITFDAVPNARSYNIYKEVNGTFGFIGKVDNEDGVLSYSFEDDNIGPDLSQTLPIPDSQVQESFQPRTAARFEQRRCFGGADALPRTLFMSRTGTESAFSYRFPTQPDDRISVDIASREAHVIRHIVPVQDLMLLTQQGEFRVTAINSDAITPSTIAIRQQSYVGSNSVHPQVVNNSVVFCANRGGHARELNYRVESQGYLTGDLSLRAAHLFDGFTLNDLAYSKAPIPVLWFVSSNGKLLCLTYIPEERVLAWHQHETGGTVESICSVSEGNFDNLYIIVKRGDNRSIERIVQVREEVLEDAVYLDASVSHNGTNTDSTAKFKVFGSNLYKAGDTVTVTAYADDGTTVRKGLFSSEDEGDVLEFTSGGQKYRVKFETDVGNQTYFTGKLLTDWPDALKNTATSSWAWARKTFSGYSHLAGQDVTVLSDGVSQDTVTVSATGTVTLTDYAVKVCAGLPYTSQAKTLPMSLEIEAGAQGRTKSVNQVFVRVEDTGALQVGMDEADLKSVTELSNTALKTGEFRTSVPSTWDEEGQIVVEATGAAPASLLNITTQVSLGD